LIRGGLKKPSKGLIKKNRFSDIKNAGRKKG